MAIFDNVQQTTQTTSAPAGSVSSWTVDDIRKSDILVFRENTTEYVDTVIAPNGFQVGLLDEAFLTDLLVTGHITGSGVIYSELGFSGSLQTLADGSNYLRGINNINVINNADGSVTVSGPDRGPSITKVQITISSDTPANTAVSVPGIPFSDYGYDPNLIDVYLNGELLLNGSNTAITATGTAEVEIGSAGDLPDLDTTTGRLRFRYPLSAEDKVLVIGRHLGGGLGGSNASHSAGAGLSLTGGQFDVNTDGVTISPNGEDKLAVTKVPNAISAGNGINSFSYDGSSSSYIAVKPVSGSPITVTAGGVGMDITSLNAVSLAGSDEVLVSQGGHLVKTTMNDIVTLVGGLGTGAPQNGAYLVVQSNSSLTHERALVAGDGLGINDGGANNNFTVSAVLETAGGLKFVSGKLAIKVADFVGTGLTDNNGNIDINVSSLAGSGLSVSGSQLTLDFSQVAAATNTIQVAAGDGISTSGIATLGTASSTINVSVNSSHLAGTGLAVSNNNLDLYVQGTNGITISNGSADGDGFTPIVIDGSNLQSTADITEVVAGTGLTGGGDTGSITLNVGGLTVSELDADAVTAAGEAFADNDATLMTSAAINDLIESKGYTTVSGDITKITAGEGLSGGGNTGDVTVNLELNSLPTSTADSDGDFFVVVNDAGTQKKLTKANINNSTFNNDAGYTTNTGTVTSIGLTAGNLIDITGGPVTTAGNIQLDVDLSELATSTADADGDFFAVVDAANVQKKLTKANIALSGFNNDAGFITSVADSSTTEKGLIEIATNAEATAGSATDKAIVPSNLGSINVSTFTNDSNYLTSVTTSNISASSLLIAGESFVDDDSNIMSAAAINDLIESKGYTTDSGDITNVIAGSGLKDGGDTGDVTVNVDYDGADSVVKSATDGTGITVDSDNDLILLHDADSDTVKYVKPSQLTSGVAGVIGSAEDGDYTDGLFSSFTASTPTGTAVDKFNEVLKLLAPAPAPDIKSINTTTSNGISAKLSFGSTNTGAPTYANSAAAAGMTAIDTNSVYAPATQGTSERLGVYTTAANVEGIVNHDVGIDQYANTVVNYVADSFGNGELGTLKLFVNDMTTPVHSVDLSSFTGTGNPGSGTGTSFTANSGFFQASTAKDATSEGGTSFNIFKHRTAKYRIHTGHQREGWNYARVVHTLSSGDKTTNYIEWVNDTDSTAITSSGTAVSNVTGSDEFVLSGIKYFKTASFDYTTTINDAHRAIHTATPIVFNSQYGSITTATDQNAVNLISTFPSVESGEDYTKTIVVSASGTFNVSSAGFPASGLLNQSSTLSVDVVHPRESKNASGIGSASVSNLLMWYPSSSSTEHELEDFDSEIYRQQAGNYATQDDVYTSSAYVTPWNSATKLTSGDAGHNTGLVQYQGSLKAPRNTLLNGNFASITNGPASNADYSGITSGTRTYYRSFKKTSAGSVRDIRLTMRGSGTIVTNGTSFGTDTANFKVYIKIPGTTGWMDLATEFTLGSTNDNDGARVSTWTPNLSASQDRHNYASFGLSTISQGEYILVRIEADASWTGYISKMIMRFGASTGDETTVPDSCTSLSCTTANGIDAKLSFGASQSIPTSDANQPYTNVAGTNGLASVDINNLYSEGGIRKGIYGTIAQKVGVVNSAEGGDGGNFAANAVRYGNEGVIKLYVNDALVHSLDLSSFTGSGVPGSGSGTSLETTHNASGFTNISTAAYVTWSDGIPDYRYNVRTLKYQIGTQHQRSGHNWVRVVHDGVTGSPHNTNYIEWVNDPNADTVTFSNVDLANFSDSDTSHLSGIEYFNSPSTTFKYRVNNMHRNIFSKETDALGFIDPTNVSISNLEITGAGIQDPADVNALRNSVPSLLTNSDTNYTLPMDVTGSFNYTPSKTLPGTYGTSANNVSINAKAYHPISNASGASQAASKNNFLVWTPTQSTSLAQADPPTAEDFSGERYRLKDVAFSTVNDITGNYWDSTQSLVGNGASSNAGHNSGLCIYNGYLIPPSVAGNSGDFATGLQGPAGNVDYSIGNVSTTVRTYLRHFYNTNTGDSVGSFTISMTGTGSLKAETGARNQANLQAGDTNFYMKIKFVYPASPGSEAAKTTGWLDCGTNIGNYGNSDGDGCSDQGNDNLNVVWNNNTQSVSILYPADRGLYGTSSSFSRNYVIIKIETHKEWTGKFTALSITP